MRDPLCELLSRYEATDDQELEDLESMRRHAANLGDPFSRAQFPAHFTGSAVITDEAGERVLLLLHAKLNRWLQPGGHADVMDGGAMEGTALREALEETGLDVYLHPTAPTPLDLDSHTIPARGDEPEHEHLDVRYLFVALDAEALSHDPAESHGAQWLSWEEALAKADEPAMKRLLTKGKAWAAKR